MSKLKALVNGRIILNDGIYNEKVLLMDEKIRSIIDNRDFREDMAEEIIDTKGYYISPGFIDIHIHGSGGMDTMDATLEALEVISSTILAYGTTAFLPTTMTMDMTSIHNALDNIREAKAVGLSGAKILGAHMEGPFISKKFKGAQNEEFIIEPEFSCIKDYLDMIKIITMAPEVEGSLEFIKSIKEHSKAVLSIGHSAATYQQTMDAIDEGISHCTHILNAMTPLHHREPGVLGAVFNSTITCELIADKIHVHPELFKLLLKIKGTDQLLLVTDAVRACCMKDGIYELGGQQVVLKEGKVELLGGGLAGSALTLNRAVKNFVEVTGIPLYQGIKLVTQNPAKLVGIEESKGSIDVGKDSDIIVFDEDLQVRMVFIEGHSRLGGNLC